MNKNVKISIILVLIIIILCGIMLFVSTKFVEKTEAKVDTKPSDIKADKIYLNDIEKLPKEYSLEQAVKDNCVVSIHGKEIYNKDELDKFIECVNNNREYCIRCINYTIEGDMIITDVYFEGDNNFRAVLDSTRDKWSAEKDKNYEYCKFKRLEQEETGEQTTIILKEAVEGKIEELIITWYNTETQIINK